MGAIDATVSGYLGRDAEDIAGGKGISFSVATEAGWGESKRTTWVRVSVWGKRAEALRSLLRKGSFVIASGELSAREWESNGKRGTSIELNADRLHLGPKTSSGGGSAGGDDGIPF